MAKFNVALVTLLLFADALRVNNTAYADFNETNEDNTFRRPKP